VVITMIDEWGKIKLEDVFEPMRWSLLLHEGSILGNLDDFSNTDVSKFLSIFGIVAIFLQGSDGKNLSRRCHSEGEVSIAS
jgi:hypothetical protein